MIINNRIIIELKIINDNLEYTNEENTKSQILLNFPGIQV